MMTARLARMRSLLPSLDASLQSFTASSTSFKVIRTIPTAAAETSAAMSTGAQPTEPRTLFVLDSSYNPPSRAHLALASTAIVNSKEPGPHRLLFLFSTHNADKSPSPAAFSQRVAMMILCAEDLQKDMEERSRVPIDVGLTTAPYYTDKSLAISNTEPCQYPSRPTHVHLLGYDTLTRFLAPKYYKDFTPPLSALEPYFGVGHKLLVLLRPDSSSDNAVTGDTEEEQRAFITNLAKGSLASDGLKPEWASQIRIMEGDRIKEAVGISSTVIRNASKSQDWETVNLMCTDGVAAWIRQENLYQNDE